MHNTIFHCPSAKPGLCRETNEGSKEPPEARILATAQAKLTESAGKRGHNHCCSIIAQLTVVAKQSEGYVWLGLSVEHLLEALWKLGTTTGWGMTA